MRILELTGRAASTGVRYRKQHSRTSCGILRFGGNGRVELPHASSPVTQFLSRADEALSSICNLLALHPRIACALLCALILLAGQLDTRLP